MEIKTTKEIKEYSLRLNAGYSCHGSFEVLRENNEKKWVSAEDILNELKELERTKENRVLTQFGIFNLISQIQKHIDKKKEASEEVRPSNVRGR